MKKKITNIKIKNRARKITHRRINNSMNIQKMKILSRLISITMTRIKGANKAKA